MGHGGADTGIGFALLAPRGSALKWIQWENGFRGCETVNRERVGHQLVEAKVISSENLTKALAIQQGEGGRLGSIFVRMGVLSEPTLLEFLSQHYGVPTVELSICFIDANLRELLPLEVVQQHLVVPVKKTASRLTLAMVDPTNSSLLDELRFRTGLHITPMVATESDIRKTISKAYELSGNGFSSKNGMEPELETGIQQAREAE